MKRLDAQEVRSKNDSLEDGLIRQRLHFLLTLTSALILSKATSNALLRIEMYTCESVLTLYYVSLYCLMLL